MISNDQLIGTTIDGKYRLDRIVGNGGMGAVYAGMHLQLNRHVAVKVLRTDLLPNQTMIARLEREARASARIEHPNAVRMYDFGTLPAFGSYLVMEYVEGVSLRRLLSDRGRLPVDLVADVVSQTSAALETAHANGVIHRDVKPENLMVSFSDDGRPLVKVVDFGIAKLLCSDGATQLTRPSDVIGTPRYMAPEQFTGEEIDTRVDVYALSVVAFESVTGRAPFEGTFSEIIGKHIYADPPSFESLGVDVPADVERVVRMGLAKSPDERFQSPRAFAGAFVEACGLQVPSVSDVGHVWATPTYASYDSSEAFTSSGSTVVAGSPEAAVGTSDDLVTNVDASDGWVEQTRVRAKTRLGYREGSRIVVPLSEKTSSSLRNARETAKLFVPPILHRRSAIAGALVLGACLFFWMMAVQRTNAPASAIPVPASAAGPSATSPVSASVREGSSEPAAEAEPAPETLAESETPDPAAGADDARANRSGKAAARGPGESRLKRFGRALRVDRHLRRLF